MEMSRSMGRSRRHREGLEKAIHKYVDPYNGRRSKLELDKLGINQRRRRF